MTERLKTASNHDDLGQRFINTFCYSVRGSTFPAFKSPSLNVVDLDLAVGLEEMSGGCKISDGKATGIDHDPPWLDSRRRGAAWQRFSWRWLLMALIRS
jgi:hypothetical protein